MESASIAMRVVEDEARSAARSNAKVLLTGESGVGKDVVAHMIHERSSRSRAPMVTINCAGVPDTLLESEMFGHMKGSFTNAFRDKRGWLELADSGTIFMDEVGEMSLRMQAMLLRFLETGEIQRVGSERRSPILDVRVIAATNRRLLDRVADKTFREDLYYRLNVIHIEIPPLRDRRDDVAPLVAHFAQNFSETHRVPAPEIATEAMQRLLSYHWPGNVRELKNVVERLVLRSQDGRVGVGDLPLEIRNAAVDRVSATTSTTAGAQPRGAALAETLFDQIVRHGDSFWSAVYEPFMARDLTRNDVREIVRLGLEQTRGNYKLLVSCLNMPPEDYKRFLSVLRKHQCHVPFQRFRTVPVGMRDEAPMAFAASA